MICPKAIIDVGLTYEGVFFFKYIKRKGTKAVTHNTCWSALKYKVIEKYDERFDDEEAKMKSEQHIARLRNWLEPEVEIKDKFGRDITPTKDYPDAILIENTKDLVNRKWQIIKNFISKDENDFKDIKTETLTLTGFFNKCLASDKNSFDRMIVEDFIKTYPKEDW